VRLWQVIVLALLPFAGNFAGGVLAEVVAATKRRVSIALHAAAGIVFAVIGVELMPRTLENTAPWIVVLAFCLGGIASIAIKTGVKRVQARRGGSAGPWMIYIAVSTDLFTDGLLIGTGSAVSFTLALLLAVAQVLADIPEGFASIVNFRNQGIPRRTRILLSLGFAVPILVAAVGSYWFLRDAPSAWQMGALAFAAGMLTVLAVEDIVPEAHEAIEDFPLATGAAIGGFALFTLISSYFEA
jgi:ZIP family zinc transporter